MKKIKYFLEYLVAFCFLKGLGLLSVRRSGSVGSFVGSLFSKLSVTPNKVATSNIKMAYPNMDKEEVELLRIASARNIGQTFCELPSVYKLDKKAFRKLVKISGAKHINDNKGALILTGHLGNWELVLKYFDLYDKSMANIYRPANNKLVDKMIVEARNHQGVQIPKGRAGGRMIIKAIKEGQYVGILNDQKMNDGIESTFFGKKAMTASAIAELSIKYNLPIVPVFCIRKGVNEIAKGKTAFELIAKPPIFPRVKNDKEYTKLSHVELKAEVSRRIDICNQTIEDEVRKYPEQWMWFHKRWS